MRALLVLACLPIAGCATTPAQRVCDAATAGALTGSTASTELGGQVLKATGARTLRWVQPGTMVTMDFRQDRANVRLDSDNRVTKIDCG